MGKRPTQLPRDVVDLLARSYGLITTAEARQAGVHVGRLRRLVDAGLLTQFAHGCYVDATRIKRLDDWALHREKARAFAISCGSDAYLVGWSSAVCWRLPTVGLPPALPTVVRPSAPGRGPSRTAYGRILVAELPPEHLYGSNRYGLMSQSWTAVDLARRAPLHHALVVADHVARNGGDLSAVAGCMAGWPAAHRSRWVAEHADPNSESPLETLGRFTCIEFDLPMPVSNAWVGRDGPERRVDGLWPYHRAASEADGAIKYNNRSDAAQIVRAQNEREFWLRRLGLDFVRYSAPDVYGDRTALAGRFSALLRDNPAGEPIRWWKDVPGVGPVEPKDEDWPSPEPLRLVLPAGWRHGLEDDLSSDGDSINNPDAG
jgi:hypothetical protein